MCKIQRKYACLVCHQKTVNEKNSYEQNLQNYPYTIFSVSFSLFLSPSLPFPLTLYLSISLSLYLSLSIYLSLSSLYLSSLYLSSLLISSLSLFLSAVVVCWRTLWLLSFFCIEGKELGWVVGMSRVYERMSA